MSKVIMSATHKDNKDVLVKVKIENRNDADVIFCLSRLIDKVAETIGIPKKIVLLTIISADQSISTGKEKAAQAVATAERQTLN